MVADFSTSCQPHDTTLSAGLWRRGLGLDAALAGGLLLIALSVLAPIPGRHYHIGPVWFHGFLRTLYTRSALWNLENGSPLSFRINHEPLSNDHPYTRHPPLLIVALQLWYFVDRDFSFAEGVPIAFSLGSCLTLFVAVRLIWSRRIAVYMLLAVILSPAFVFFGTFVNFEPPCLFFIILGWSLYAGWWYTEKNGLLVAAMVALFGGCMSDWQAYFLTGAVALHAVITKRKAGWVAGVCLGFVGISSFALFLLFCVFAQTGSFGGGALWESFMNRIGMSPVFVPMWGPIDPELLTQYTPSEWLGQVGGQIVELIGIPLIAATLIWVAGNFFTKRPRSGGGREGWVLLLFVPGVINNLVFNGLVWNQPFFQIYLLPGCAMASALALDRMGRLVAGKAVYFSLVSLFFAALAFQTGLVLWRHLP